MINIRLHTIRAFDCSLSSYDSGDPIQLIGFTEKQSDIQETLSTLSFYVKYVDRETSLPNVVLHYGTTTNDSGNPALQIFNGSATGKTSITQPLTGYRLYNYRALPKDMSLEQAQEIYNLHRLDNLIGL